MPARTQASPIGRTPAERCGDKQIDRGVLQKIHAVCEQRDRADGASNRELDAEIGQVQKSNDDDNLAQSHVRSRYVDAATEPVAGVVGTKRHVRV
jgi:hypothetical protein